MEKSITINFFAPVNQLGYGIVGKNLSLELDKHIQVCLVPYGQITGLEKEEVEHVRKMLSRVAEIDFSNIGIYCGYGNQMYSFCGSKRIGYTIFETQELSKDWINQLKQLDKVWVPSNWAKEILKKYNIEADVIPCGVNINIFKPDPKFKENSTKKNPMFANKFKFLSVGKWEKRKNQELLIRAFCEEFKPEEDVVLYGWWHNPFLKKGFINELIPCISNGHKLYTKESPEGSTILICNPVQSHYQLANVYQQMDCGVFPYRAEGWCLPLMEAMACGLPCIATNYSAPTDYINDKNCFLLNPGKLVPADDGRFFRGNLGNWAEPSIEELKKLMRNAYANRKGLTPQKGVSAAVTIKKWFWWNSANKAISSILNLQ